MARASLLLYSSELSCSCRCTGAGAARQLSYPQASAVQAPEQGAAVNPRQGKKRGGKKQAQKVCSSCGTTTALHARRPHVYQTHLVITLMVSHAAHMHLP